MECKIVEDITNCSPVEAQRILSKIPCSQEWAAICRVRGPVKR
jgi:hypothetical protein